MESRDSEDSANEPQTKQRSEKKIIGFLGCERFGLCRRMRLGEKKGRSIECECEKSV